jgi:nucleotide-binding universal stress UspA family protein
MRKNPTARVVVATSGSSSSKAAVDYAAHEASNRGSALEIVHVIWPTAVGPLPGSPDVMVREAGWDVLSAAKDRAVHVAPEVRVTMSLLTGSRADCLVHHARDADLLVLGAPPRTLVDWVLAGTTVTGAASRAACPVVVVPADSVGRTRTGILLVGLKNVDGDDHLVRTAFAVARQNQASLRIVHAGALTSTHQATRTIEDRLIDLRMTFPEVQVEVEVAAEPPVAALRERSGAADLVMISRPTHGGVLHHLGATARALLKESTCPVEVVPPRARALPGEAVGVDTAVVA